MREGTIPIIISISFLVVHVALLYVILILNRRTGSRTLCIAPLFPKISDQEKSLDASDILNCEFEYARTTASEAMNDRHTMINYYLIITGIIASGTVTLIVEKNNHSFIGTILLWLLCCMGWFYFLKIIRLRQVWHDSALAMNRIKEFYLMYSKDIDGNILNKAFRWKPHTLPPPDKPWTIFFYSAMLIGFIDSVSYIAGGILIDLKAFSSFPFVRVGFYALFGLLFFFGSSCSRVGKKGAQNSIRWF